jgi:hypothetical protein
MSMAQYSAILGENPVVIDVKGILSQQQLREAQIRYWRL